MSASSGTGETSTGAGTAPGTNTRAGTVVALNRSAAHDFSKQTEEAVTFVAGVGMAGDAHASAQVQHRSRIRADPTQPTLRQVHLLHAELLDEVREAGHDVSPGSIGDNVTTRGVDLLGLPTGALLRLGGEVLLGVTGLRNPCAQLDRYSDGLRSAVLDRTPDGVLVRRASVMAVVLQGGQVRTGDPVTVALPPAPLLPLAPV